MQKQIRFWTKQEVDVLMSNILKYATHTQAFRETAQQINRTVDACAFKHSILVKPRSRTQRRILNDYSQAPSSKSIKLPVVTVFNGHKSEAEVIISKDNLIVARTGSIVITIEQ